MSITTSVKVQLRVTFSLLLLSTAVVGVVGIVGVTETSHNAGNTISQTTTASAPTTPIVRAAATATTSATATVTRVSVVSRKPYGYEVDTCHDIYMEQSANASSVYNANFEHCETVANRTLRHLALDEATERAQIEAGAATICENLERCNLLESDYEYFQCNMEIAPVNLDIIVDIRFNATRGAESLRADYDQVQQEFLLCTIEAQRSFVNDMRAAYDELMHCKATL